MGSRLTLVDEPGNPVNPRAILTADATRAPLGYVPDILLDYVHTVRDEGPVSATVAHVNGPDTPPHLRLLVRLDGHAPPGYRPFDGQSWQPLAHAARAPGQLLASGGVGAAEEGRAALG